MVIVLNASGTPSRAEADVQSVAKRLRAAHEDPHDDSPLFALIEEMPRVQIDQGKSDLFRGRVDHSRRRVSDHS